VARTAGVNEQTKTRNFRVEAEPKEKVKEEEKEKKMDKKGGGEEKLLPWPSFSSHNRGEKHCIRISVAFRLYLVKII
jgi:hypothetical protein